MLGLDLVDGNLFVFRLGQGPRLGDALDPRRGILVAVSCSLFVPFQSLLEVDWNVHANLIEVSHCEFCGTESCLSRTSGILMSQLFIFRKLSFVPAKEPLADSHIRLWFSLTRCERIIVH
jgi:hypothetical protein